MDTEQAPTFHPTKHQQQVNNYMDKKKIPEGQARDLVARDLVSERSRKRLEETKKLIIIDPLTGLYNHRGLLGDVTANPPIEGRLQQMFAHSQRTGESLAAVMIDLDNFKQYNDTYGHMDGDEALILFTKLMKDVIRDSDFPVRYGGEEFIIILPDTNIVEGSAIVERLRKIVEQCRGFKRPLTISAGITCFDPKDQPSPINTPQELIKEADVLVYEAKDRGRNQTVSSISPNPVSVLKR